MRCIDARISQRERTPGEPSREEGLEKPRPEPAVLPTSGGRSPEVRQGQAGTGDQLPAAGEPGSVPGIVESEERPGLPFGRPRPSERVSGEPELGGHSDSGIGTPSQPAVSNADRISEAEGSAS